VENNYCIGVVNQACQLQDMALASMYTYPTELVQICEKALESESQNSNQDELLIDVPAEKLDQQMQIYPEEKEQVSSSNEILMVDNTAENGLTEEPVVENSIETDLSARVSDEEEDESTLLSKSLCEKHGYVLVDYLCSKSTDYSLDQLLMLLSRAQVFIGDFRLSRNLFDPITEEETLLECFEFVKQKIH
jgi:hypothetical protein